MALNTKRMQTFFNEFLVTTVSFLNQFSSECEDKFFELERKLYKIECNLTIVEAKVSGAEQRFELTFLRNDFFKLASVPTDIPIEEKTISQNLPEVEALKQVEQVSKELPVSPLPVPSEVVAKEEPKAPEPTNDNLIKISESNVYSRYFKMLKYGINVQAVKLKMQSEDYDPSLLDNPDLMIEKTAEDSLEEE